MPEPLAPEVLRRLPVIKKAGKKEENQYTQARKHRKNIVPEYCPAVRSSLL